MRLADLKIDPDFKNLLPPLSKEEYTQLDRNISSKGFDEAYPIIIWNKTIIDGHNRYEICKFHGIEDVPVVEKHYSSKEEAIAAIYALQIGRRNLTPEQTKYFTGKRLEAEKNVQRRSDKERDAETGRYIQKHQNDAFGNGKTSERIAKEIGKSSAYVERSEQFAKGLDAADEVDPDIKQDVLTGKIKVTQKEITDIANADNAEKKKEMVAELRKPKSERINVTDTERKCKKCGKTLPISYFSDRKHPYECDECESLRRKLDRIKNMVMPDALNPDKAQDIPDEIIVTKFRNILETSVKSFRMQLKYEARMSDAIREELLNVVEDHLKEINKLKGEIKDETEGQAV